MNTPQAVSELYSHTDAVVNTKPAQNDTITETDSPRFVLVPVELIKCRQINDADFRQAVLMMSYSRADQHEIWPEQETLAKDLGCSVRKVNRSIATLHDSGIVPITRRLRCTKGDRKGEYRQCVYSLSKIWGMIPEQVANKSADHTPKQARDFKKPPSQNRPATRQICRSNKNNKDSVNEIEQHTGTVSSGDAVSSPDVVVSDMNNEDMETVNLLVSAGVEKPAAVDFVVSLGSGLCRYHLDAYRKSKTAESVSWLCSNLQNPTRTYAMKRRNTGYVASGSPHSIPEPSRPAQGKQLDREKETPGTKSLQSARAFMDKLRGGISYSGYTNTEGLKQR